MKLKKLIMLAILVLLIVGCSDDGKKSLGFSLDVGEIDSNHAVGGRSFGVYFWDMEHLSKNLGDIQRLDSFVFVAAYDEGFKEMIFTNQATVTLTVDDSTYYPREIDPDFDYDEYLLAFNIERDGSNSVNFTLNYLCNDVEFSENATVTYVNPLNSYTINNNITNGAIIKFDWDLTHNNHYQLLSAQQYNFEGWENPFYSRKLKSSARTFTFPRDYAVNLDYINYYSLVQVKQMNTSKIIGLSVALYAYNIDDYDRLETRTPNQIVKDEFRMLHKPLLRSLEF